MSMSSQEYYAQKQRMLQEGGTLLVVNSESNQGFAYELLRDDRDAKIQRLKLEGINVSFLENVCKFVRVYQVMDLTLTSCRFPKEWSGRWLTPFATLEIVSPRDKPDLSVLNAVPTLTTLKLDSWRFNMQGTLQHIKNLSIAGCAQINKFPKGFPNLESLTIDHQFTWESDPFAGVTLLKLTELNIHSCDALVTCDFLTHMPNLKTLCIESCDNLVSVSFIPVLIAEVHIDGCALLRSLPHVLRVSLRVLRITDCPLMTTFEQLPISFLGLEDYRLNYSFDTSAYTDSAAAWTLENERKKRGRVGELQGDVANLIGKFMKWPVAGQDE